MIQRSGTVKWFSRVKGFGFILPADGGAEVFVHYSAIEGTGYRNLHEGDEVLYRLVDVGKGPQAQDVRRLNRWGGGDKEPDIGYS